MNQDTIEKETLERAREVIKQEAIAAQKGIHRFDNQDILRFAQELLAASERERELAATVEELERKLSVAREALDDIKNRGKGRGGCAVVTTETLRGIAKEALNKIDGMGEK